MTRQEFAVFDDLDGHEQVVVCSRRAQRPAGDHRDPLHRPRPRARRHPVPRLPQRRGRAARRAQPRPRDVLQGGHGRARPRRRQGGDHRRPAHPEDPGAAARLRTLRAVPRRALLHRLRRRHLLRGHGRHRPGVPLRHRAHGRPRRRRRLLGAHGVRRVPGHAGRSRGDLGGAHAGRPHRRRRRRRQGRPPPGRAPARGRGRRRRHRRPRAVRTPRHRGPPRGAHRGRTPTALVASPLDVYAPCALGRRPHRRGGRHPAARGSCAARRTTSSPTPGWRSSSPTAGSSTRPTTS